MKIFPTAKQLVQSKRQIKESFYYENEENIYKSIRAVLFYSDLRFTCLTSGFEIFTKNKTLKISTFLKIEYISYWVNFTHFLKKIKNTHQLKLASLDTYKVWYLKWKFRKLKMRCSEKKMEKGVGILKLFLTFVLNLID